MFLFFPLAVTFTFTLATPLFTVLISKSLVYRVTVAGVELSRGPVGISVEVSLLRGEGPVAGPGGAVLLREVAVVVVHLVYGRLSAGPPAPPLLPLLLLGGGGGGGGDDGVWGGPRAVTPSVRLEGGGGSWDPHFLSPSEGQ